MYFESGNDGCGDNDNTPDCSDINNDNDGLIEIASLEQLDSVRRDHDRCHKTTFNLSHTSHCQHRAHSL